MNNFELGKIYEVEVKEDDEVYSVDYTVVGVTDRFAFLAPLIKTKTKECIDMSRVLVYENSENSVKPIRAIERVLAEDE